jgi:arylformamidase
MRYDISMPIQVGMPVYKNYPDKTPSFEVIRTFDKHTVFETNITMNLHTGTHLDYPKHTLPDGATSTNHDLTPLIGSATVYDLTHVEAGIDVTDLESLPIQAHDFVLFKTKSSWDTTFNPDFIYVNESAAKYLVAKKVRGVGVDALGVERAQPGHPTHDLLLSNNIIILEGVQLKDVPEGKYKMTCLPLKIEGVEALPVRAILEDEAL